MNKLKLTTFIFSIFLIFTSCSNDDSTDGGNESISFTQAYLSTLGDPSFGYYDFQLFLMGSDRMVDLDNSEINGTGPLLYLEIVNDSNDGLPEAGLYTVRPEGTSSNDSRSIDWGWYKTLEINSVGYNETFIVREGTIEISYNDSQMTFNYNFTLKSQDDEEITKQISGEYNQQVIVTDAELW